MIAKQQDFTKNSVVTLCSKHSMEEIKKDERIFLSNDNTSRDVLLTSYLLFAGFEAFLINLMRIIL